MRDRLLRLPKAELHVHLDGSVRPDTMLELARARGVGLPAATPNELASYMVVSEADTLEAYLARFGVTLSVMQDVEAIERIAYELAVDHVEENVRYLEARFCPVLSTERGLTAERAVDAALAGLRRAEVDHDIRTGLIVCTIRTFEPARSLELAELAVAYLDRGVVGFDLAGAESGYPVRDHAAAFDRAAAGGVPITIHAGEAFGPDSIRQAIELGHARRIGHGTRLHEDRALLELVRRARIPLEVCLTSNVQTGVVDSVSFHPARRYHLAGVQISLATDNRLMSGVTLTKEYVKAHEALDFTWPELVAVARAGLEHAFAPRDLHHELLRSFDEEVAALDAG